MGDTTLLISAERYFRGLGPRGRTVIFQLPLFVTMLLVTVLVVLLHPTLDWSLPLILSMGAQLLLLGGCALIPWERLPARAVLVIPVLDCLAVGLTREAGDQYLAVLGFLLAFPVVWISAGPRRPRVAVAVMATVLSAVLPPIILGTGFDRADFIRIALLPVILGAIAVTTYGAFNVISFQRRSLEKRESEVRELLAASQDREQLLSTVLDTVSVAVSAVDPQGHTILANHQYSSDVTRAVRKDELAENPSDLTIYGPDRATPLPPEQSPRRRAARGEAFTDELLWIGSGTSQRAYSATCRLIKAPDGRHTGAVMAFTDVTALVEALAVKDQFVSSVSHELRTPLTSILGYLALALDEDLDPDLEDYLTVIRRNTQRLLGLVDDLLATATDGLNASPCPADLGEILAHSVEAACPRAQAAGVTLTLDLEPGSQLTGNFDPDRIGQAIDNLVSNAIKYTADGGSVTISAGTKDDTLYCQVTDTGIGMTEEEQSKAFTRFFRAANLHSSTIPGAGLGLAITKSIIENHNGTISISSSPGKGTTVSLTLPRAAADARSAEVSA
ncbi:ATP-binding protein [Pseudarthrobacter sp. BRE9]|uniref:sensor histidine kinase n=1 Tax=Pseudarthrobacter sp. BRE9 TaxID=2962582 RepID=UPI0028820B49|nr:ATP-binding protein [Pseudarthrobacter sp. BRE9]MDT0168096.1 ATP-binding protein [Pseudarthrobacter sp. BRE9]